MILVFVGVVDCALVLVRIILSVARVAITSARMGMVVAGQALLVVAGAVPSFVPVGPMVLIFVEVIVVGVVDCARVLVRIILSIVRGTIILARVGMVVARQALLIVAGAIPSFVRVSPMVFVEVIVVGVVDCALVLVRIILSVVRGAIILARVGMVVARQALLIVAGAIPSFVPVRPMVFIEVIVEVIVVGVVDCARVLVRIILSIVRGTIILARVGMVVARQALLIVAGAIPSFVRVSPMVFVEVIVVGVVDCALVLVRVILSVVRGTIILARVGVVVARQALLIVAGAIPSFVRVSPMVFVEVIVEVIVVGVVDCAGVLVHIILSVVRGAIILARVGLVVARQALLTVAGAIPSFVRVSPMVFVEVIVVVVVVDCALVLVRVILSV